MRGLVGTPHLHVSAHLIKIGKGALKGLVGNPGELAPLNQVRGLCTKSRLHGTKLCKAVHCVDVCKLHQQWTGGIVQFNEEEEGNAGAVSMPGAATSTLSQTHCMAHPCLFPCTPLPITYLPLFSLAHMSHPDFTYSYLLLETPIQASLCHSPIH